MGVSDLKVNSKFNKYVTKILNEMGNEMNEGAKWESIPKSGDCVLALL